MDIFDYSLKEQIKKDAPLADRMRPRNLDEFFGQSHILSPGRLLRRAIQADKLSSLIFFGPPGTGKTTLARIIANSTKAQFVSLNAVLSGVKDIRESIVKAEKYRQEHQLKTILFIDEVHRFNKAQQDALLPHVENGIVILIGATTENPYFEVNKALVSRSRIFQLRSLTTEDLQQVLKSVLIDRERGYGELKVNITEDAAVHLIHTANGDARALLNALELAVITSKVDKDGSIYVDLAAAEESIQKKAVLYDKDGDAHFDTISAFIKSIRGSDPDAALYWMAKMVYAGEDPRFIFRRMIILAAEDIGMADPNALHVVISASQAFDYVGMPEGRFHLAQACLYLSTAPKSNSAFAFFDALDAVNKEQVDDVPNHLRDGNRDKEGFGHGKGYLYPHAYQDHWVSQQYLPKTLQGRTFYQPSESGYEFKVKDDVVRRREVQLAAILEATESEQQGQEDYWRGRTLGNTGELLTEIRDYTFSRVNIARDNLILILNAGSGLFLGEAVRKAPEGTVYGLVRNDEEKKLLEGQYSDREFLFRPIILKTTFQSDNPDFSSLFKENIKFDLIMGRNSLSAIKNKKTILNRINSLLDRNGYLTLVESIPAKGQRLSQYIPQGELSKDLYKKLIESENTIYDDKTNFQVNWDEGTLQDNLNDAGFQVKQIKITEFQNKTHVSQSKINQWFLLHRQNKLSYADYLQQNLSNEEIQQVKNYFQAKLSGQVIKWKTTWVFVKARLHPGSQK